MAKSKVVIVGGGFGGLTLAQGLRKVDVEVTLVDKTNHHLFQPLLYQVAVGALSPADVASPLRSVFRNQKNLRLLLDEVLSIDKKKRLVYLKSKDVLAFDYLILAPGNQPSYFGKDQWAELAPGLKTIRDALAIREQMILAYEIAACVPDPLERQRYLTFVVVGGGPTGVEMAGALIEIGQEVMRRDYQLKENIAVHLIEGGARLLSSFPPDLSQSAQETLEKMGVVVHCNTRVEYITEGFVQAGALKIQTANVIWAAGNRAVELLKTLEVPLDNSGRVLVQPDLSIPEYPNIFVIGDAAASAYAPGQYLPGVAQVAMQQADYLAKIFQLQVAPESRKPFHYFDKGNMATIGRAKAIAQIGKFNLSGFIAWAIWALIHVVYLINFRSRTRVMLEWIWFYFTFQPGARIIYWQPSSKK